MNGSHLEDAWNLNPKSEVEKATKTPCLPKQSPRAWELVSPVPVEKGTEVEANIRIS